MREYDLIVIGFGKAGKTLAARQAAAGKKVALIEKSPAMYGGTCINIACIPTKTMLVAAEKGLGFDEVMAQRSAVVSRLNKKNYAAVSGTADVIDARARFVSNKVVEVSAGADTEQISRDWRNPRMLMIPPGSRASARVLAGWGSSAEGISALSLRVFSISLGPR